MPHEANYSHEAYGINSHSVWNPRYRNKVLVGPVDARLKERLAEIAMRYGFDRLAVELMPDPVPLLVSAPAKFSPAEIVSLFKWITSRRLRKAFESLRRQYWGTHATLWAEEYSVGTAGQVGAETIKRSIEESQKEQFQVLKT